LSGLAMGLAAFGYLSPIAGALAQEGIDLAVILNALRALAPGRRTAVNALTADAARAIAAEHSDLTATLDRLRVITVALDTTSPGESRVLLDEADRLIKGTIVRHEQADERELYPRLRRHLADNHGLAAMSVAHREILHLSRLLTRMVASSTHELLDPPTIREMQRVIVTLEALVRLHTAEEDEIVAAATHA
ncbi:MAG TPA: hemerythrin domain-containing protein, partial [Hyphomicrobiaceae bacterium]|nr:hemerythrin domain-containing protein [Hyphomicrobiaceae bacterium]